MPYPPFIIICVCIAFYFIILKGKLFFQQGKCHLFTVNTVNDISFMNYFDNLITHERDLSFGLLSSLDIHTPALNFLHLEGGTVTAVTATTKTTTTTTMTTITVPEPKMMTAILLTKTKTTTRTMIEEGAVNRSPLQALFLLHRGGAWPATGPGAI